MVLAVLRWAFRIWVAVGILSSATLVSAQKEDSIQPPRYHEWAILNGCNESIRVATRADGRIRGWDELQPGQQKGYRSAETTIGVHARIGSGGSWWAPAGYLWREHTVDLDRPEFSYRVDAGAAGTPVTFLFFDILRQPLVTVCEP